MINKINEAVKFYKTAAKSQANNLAAVYGLLKSIKNLSILANYVYF